MQFSFDDLSHLLTKVRYRAFKMNLASLQISDGTVSSSSSSSTEKDEWPEGLRVLEMDELKTLSKQCTPKNKLSEGAQGQVYGVTFGGELIAIKRTKIENSTKSAEFHNEVRVLYQLQAAQEQKTKQRVIKMLGAGKDENGYGYMLMEYATETFKQFCADEGNNGKLQETFKHLEEALVFLKNQRVIHRDVKPANILMVDGSPVLADFGLAVTEAVDLEEGWQQCSEQQREQVGTHVYMSPRSVLGVCYDFNKDTWALGLMMYQIAMCVPPAGDSRFDCTQKRLIDLQKWFEELKFPDKPQNTTFQSLWEKSIKICQPQIQEYKRLKNSLTSTPRKRKTSPTSTSPASSSPTSSSSSRKSSRSFSRSPSRSPTLTSTSSSRIGIS